MPGVSASTFFGSPIFEDVYFCGDERLKQILQLLIQYEAESLSLAEPL